ncbi:MAG: hypothetical protein C0504_00235 [Candidatus Solibacter sp.]|nr:hypothetical protein [Candidatus Solibacter sp.]
MAIGSVWEEEAERFVAILHLSQERALHPELSRLIEDCPGEQLLDYGCGDGRILETLSSRWVIDAYDPSSLMRNIAQRRVGSRVRRLASNPAEVDGPYDVVLLGMVILCIPERDDVLRVLRDCALRMKASSRLFVTTTHPCFRPSHFSNFKTSFGGAQPFQYLADGAPFEVTLRDSGTTGIVFTDYHWSLGFTVSALRSQGLAVSSLIEVPDDPESPDRNDLVPPFLILECNKLS